MTELEACVIALIAREGPCTAYQVRMSFEQSAASTWRASTGSIYPLIRRLVERGVIRSDKAPDSKRGAKLLTVTQTGLRTVRDWLLEAPDWIGDAAADPIRTRVHFLQLLDDEDRAQSIRGMIDATQRSLADIAEKMDRLKAAGDEVERLTHQGAAAMMEARLDWLNTVEAFFRPGNAED
ncbi:MAG: PadR family transcriptional regulator [Hyphomonas sp.]|tara:strand:+ start:1912 stop:2451 length:540 start_codon:yes stop_codon:yes gene_type:complete